MNELGIIAERTALISGGVLREVGPSRRVENLAALRNTVEINAAGRVVMPGFIDCHTHLAFPPPDAADQHREAATRALTAGAGKRTVTRWRAYLGAVPRHGTTTVEIKTRVGPNGSSDTLERRAWRASGARFTPMECIPLRPSRWR